MFNLVASAQPLITAGSATDQYFTGGTAYACAGSDSCAGIADQQYQNLRFGSSFRYDVPVAPGLYFVELRFIEPNQVAAGKRRFQVTVSGQQTPILDLFALAGRLPYVLKTVALAGAGTLTIQFQGITGNAVVSAIQIRPAALLDLFSAQAVSDVVGGLSTVVPLVGLASMWQTCVSPPSCAGLDRLVITDMNGVAYQYIATPSTTAYDSTQWAPKIQ